MIDPHGVLAKIKAKELKDRLTVSIDPMLLKEFKRIVGGGNVSSATEEIIRDFCETFKASDPLSQTHKDLLNKIPQLNESQAAAAFTLITGIIEGIKHKHLIAAKSESKVKKGSM